jgi:menaquinone-dependent protoporphyrinogen oxidase
MSGVLVAYATKNGSTKAVAEAIAAELEGTGTTVDVRPARAAREPVTGRDLVVLGGAIYSGRWHRDARRFLSQHRRDLAGVPIVVFGMGPREDRPESWQRARAQLDHALAKQSWLRPAAVAVFGGVDPPARSDRHARRDLRDWTAIRNWARQAAHHIA